MGIDFSAILEYPGLANLDSKSLTQLETDDTGAFEQVCEVARSKNEYDHVIGSWNWQIEERDGSEITVHEQRTRPIEITEDWSLFTSVGFKLTFGQSLFRIYHPLRWRMFLEDQQWQDAILGGLDKFIAMFAATKCIVSHDCSAIVTCTNEPNLESAMTVSVSQWRQFEATSLSEAVPNYDVEEDENGLYPVGFWRYL